ncbi:hypothetical protein CBS101457_006796 [Exobasidium rhododendri]|nr:hypothetical protein CBS101457_006796 [Exobasidium rhododendri]
MVGKLNYSKWDALELSDDSDIEVHPNVDKKSFIRWKQQDIHQKREERKAELDGLNRERAINLILMPMLDKIYQETEKEGHSYFSREVSRLTAGREERGSKDGPEGPTPDDMILSLLLQINEDASVKGKQGSELDSGLSELLKDHKVKLAERQKAVEDGIISIEAENKKKITSDGIKEGWSSGHITKEEEPAPTSKPANTKGKKKETSIETLNSASSSSKSSLTPDSDAEDDDDDEEMPSLTPSMQAFAKLPTCLPNLALTASGLPSNFNPNRDVRPEPFDAALKYLSSHKELLREDTNTTDALLVEAFQAQMKGDGRLSRRCVEKALLVQYCNKLGKDGVNLFFKRMTTTQGRAAVVFFNDVLSTYVRISERSVALQAEPRAEEGGEEQIQLVAEDPDTVISFEVPEGPPPAEIELDGELATTMDVEKVREILQNRWDIYQSFSDDFKKALESKSLERVNKILGNMPVEEAEEVVGQLDAAGILNFQSGGIRDETGKVAM